MTDLISRVSITQFRVLNTCVLLTVTRRVGIYSIEVARVPEPVLKIEGLESRLDHMRVRKGLLAYCARMQLYSNGKG